MIYSEQNDETLVNITLLGNEKAYEALVMRYERAVIKSAYTVTRNWYLSEDAAQDAFVTGWMKLNVLREPEKFGAWVCRISKNCAKNLAVKYRDYISFDVLENREYEANEYSEEFIMQSDENELLHESISGLSEKVKLIIKLHYFEGLSIAEIADKLRIPVGTVKWQLHDGRQKIRKDFGFMEEKETDTLVEKVMKKVEQLKLWRLNNSKTGFESAYNDVLKEVEQLPESADKYHAIADVLMHGFWWLPGEKNDALIARICDAAEKGRNDEVMEFVVGREDGKLSGKDKIEFIRDKQIPRLEAGGFRKSLGREWFWLGHEYFRIGSKEAGNAAFQKVLEVLKPADVYYANAISAIRAEKEAETSDLSMLSLNATGEQYRLIDGKLRFWSQPGYGKGNLVQHSDADALFYFSSQCDSMFYDCSMKPGDVYQGSDENYSLTFAADDASCEAACGVFEGCQLWITSKTGEIVKTFYKHGIGIVRIERKTGRTAAVRTLKSYNINGGDGLIPFAVGNRWEYSADFDSSCFEYKNIFEVTSFDGTDITLWNFYLTRRSRYDENSWDDMMMQMRSGYCVEKQDGSDDEILCDVSFPMSRAELLAKTPLQKAHTKAACSVMRRILSTDPEFNPECTAKGHWNFFCYDEVTENDGKIIIGDHRAYSFEWKDMHKTGDAGYPMLFNDIYGILMDAAGCLWSDKWHAGTVLNEIKEVYGFDIKFRLCADDAGSITTAAGTFKSCIRLSLNIEGMQGGWSYRGGKKEYYFAPGIGIVRTVNYYKNDTLTGVYELTSYSGTGEGYMPIKSGMMRHYDAIGLKDGFVGSAEYTCSDENGAMVILIDRTGIQKLQAK